MPSSWEQVIDLLTEPFNSTESYLRHSRPGFDVRVILQRLTSRHVSFQDAEMA
jgi:hypothetical protein